MLCEYTYIKSNFYSIGDQSQGLMGPRQVFYPDLYTQVYFNTLYFNIAFLFLGRHTLYKYYLFYQVLIYL